MNFIFLNLSKSGQIDNYYELKLVQNNLISSFNSTSF